ncbi:hypothetical protein CERSUDRAFT_115479 [Gelatoporia subvermispora B]|uniref:RING-type domain-containing protein n=1 Tax=Ceriporiopsis subvermispora (strain B) TaxID=914234 RepID=M2RDF9_CERS8|nr:hypothetical protein CERSUDRAFT_115479 [Gelatoporia subvermispora B]
MISLSFGSLCDVCAEEYGPHNFPHSIPCGHVLCVNCCNKIIDKTHPRLSPSCPFCRETFTSDSIRLIRVDFSSSGWLTPRGSEAHDAAADIGSDDDVLLLNPGMLKSRAEVRRLENKVARVAAKKCSVEEVSSLQKELELWLTHDDKHDDQTSSLQLSAALLRAILVNHVAHSEAMKAARSVEANLRAKLSEVEEERDAVEEEIQKLRAQYSQKAQECQSLRADLSRAKIKTVAPSSGAPSSPPLTPISTASNSALISPPRPQSTASAQAARAGAVSPTPPSRSSFSSILHAPITRASSVVHQRTSSMHVPSHRSMTPSIRSGTPAISTTRSYGSESVPPVPSVPGKTRRLSLSVPPPSKMIRSGSSSDEKEKREKPIKRWLPSVDSSEAVRTPDRALSQTPASRFRPTTPAMPPRTKTPFSSHSP